MSKILALDPGAKRIGIAISDSDQVIAFDKETVTNSEEGLNRIEEICGKEDIHEVVIGTPFQKDEYHPSEDIKTKLTNRLGAVTVTLFNEDFSTQQAIDKLKETNATTKEIEKLKDQMSAKIILEKYLA